MSEEWGTPISKEKIIDRRNRLIEYQKTQDMRFTVGYQIIDENILDINYMIYEIERLNNIINEFERWVEERLEKLDIIGDDDIYMALEIALNKLQELKGSEKE